MRKKLIAFGLMMMLALGSLTACGNEAGTGTGTDTGTSAQITTTAVAPLKISFPAAQVAGTPIGSRLTE